MDGMEVGISSRVVQPEPADPRGGKSSRGRRARPHLRIFVLLYRMENYVNASIPKDQTNNVSFYNVHFL